jgi:hypothetical protein
MKLVSKNFRDRQKGGVEGGIGRMMLSKLQSYEEVKRTMVD